MGTTGPFLSQFLFTAISIEDEENSQKKVLPGFEPGTFCVLGRCDNHYTTAPVTKRRKSGSGGIRTHASGETGA